MSTKQGLSRWVQLWGAIAGILILFSGCQPTPSNSPPPINQPSPTPSLAPQPTSTSTAMPLSFPLVTRDALIGHLQSLDFERYTDTERLRARDYLRETLTSAGWKATEQEFATGINVIAERPGLNPEAGMILVAAHYDSVQGSPGADDNASGVAVALEVARLLADRPTPRGLRIVFFDQEEAGLVGSYAYVQQPTNLENLAAVVVLEMLGYSCDEPGCQQQPNGLLVDTPSDRGDFLGIVGDTEHLPLLETFQQIHQDHLPPLVTVPIPLKGLLTPIVLRSDHTPFWQKEIGAVMLTDTANFRNPHYHQATDQLATLNFDFLQGNAQIVVNAVTALLESQVSLQTAP
ncbi:MAG: M20/M25/M40 family metallo-hydrolase [Acaryochloridaceae cyanobacterium SU_2_1]|nr:M20/M25/M40 family metallo-hydrolase [Acaryochloridaceae cyanobacterium SU_2_1]